MRCLGTMIFLLSGAAMLTARAAEPWQTALGGMPLATNVAQLNRTNCVKLMLASFQSNDVVKALIFMPGATDEFYMFHRAKASLTNSPSTLLDAVCALTNQTLIRATFRAPLLLLHTAEDPLEPLSDIKDPETAARIREVKFPPHMVCNDRDWDFLLPILHRTYGLGFTPHVLSRKSFHFYRHSFAAWNLNGWQGLEAVALAGKTKFTVGRRSVVFEGDERVLALPTMDGYIRD
jgi:hypothetical protein